jgi:hypothetical protein
MRNRTITLVALAVIFLLVVIAVLFFLPTPPQPFTLATLPIPNGYTDLVRAGHMTQEGTSDFSTMTPEQLRDVVEKNTNALQIARSGLEKKVQVPVEYSQAYIQNHLPELADLKRLALAFRAEGKLAETEKRPGDAANSGLDMVRLGIESSRGGVLIDALVGVAIEAMGTAELQKVVGNLDAKSCREAAQKLEALDAQKQSWEQIMAQEHYWSRKAFPQLQWRLASLINYSSTRKAEARTEQKFRASQAKTRKLLIDLAARAYELDNGHRPSSIADLVPTYLKAIPEDPTAAAGPKSVTFTHGMTAMLMDEFPNAVTPTAGSGSRSTRGFAFSIWPMTSSALDKSVL